MRIGRRTGRRRSVRGLTAASRRAAYVARSARCSAVPRVRALTVPARRGTCESSLPLFRSARQFPAGHWQTLLPLSGHRVRRQRTVLPRRRSTSCLRPDAGNCRSYAAIQHLRLSTQCPGGDSSWAGSAVGSTRSASDARPTGQRSVSHRSVAPTAYAFCGLRCVDSKFSVH